MGVESSSGEKQPISVEKSKKKLLGYLAELDPEKIEAYFQIFDIPQSAVKDPEVQSKVDEWLQTLSQLPEQTMPKQLGQQVIDLLNRLFKS